MDTPLLLDGATGTGLTARGMPRGICPERWILENPGALTDLQSRYVAAGSQALLAPTFGVNPGKMAAYGLEDQIESYCARLVGLTRGVAGPGVLVGGDLSASSLFLSPMGEATMNDLMAFYRRPARAMADAGVDFFMVETLLNLADARAAFLAIREISDKPVYICFTVDENGRTLSGGDFPALLVTMQSMGAAAVGLNCSSGPDLMLPVFRRAVPYAEVPLIAKPNAGLPKTRDGEVHFDLGAEDFAIQADRLWAAGVRVFGGCCGSDETHIAALARVLDGRSGGWISFSGQPCIASERAVCPAGEPTLTVDIETPADAEGVAEDQMYYEGPVCLRGRDPEHLREALIVYQGRALVDCPYPVDFPGVITR